MKISKGSVAAITGGGGGIGRCLARALAEKGCDLALVDIDQEALEGTKAAVSEFAVKVSVHVADITKFEAVESMAADVLAEHGKLNILVNNAGITIQKSFETHSIADWERMIGINLWGVIYGCKAFLPALKLAAAEEGAHIINMSSMAGLLGLPNQSSYSATKSAVRMLSETLNAELDIHNIGVTAVQPGAIKTKMILTTLAESDDVKEAEKSYKMVEKIGNTPDYAAKRIVRAIEKNSVRIRIGKDAVILDILKRMFPTGLNRRIAKMSTKARLKREQAEDS